ncbi:MAG: 4Fe-4S binding protein [Candidatus Bathyarchaeota archaeon]|nr:4Fe-4S binding protein [Candidatus Bathyarchaeum sp.]
MRGQAVKQENLKETIIERKFLTKNYRLQLNKDICNGCGVCFEVCPHEAIKLLQSTVYEGHLIQKPSIDIDDDACVMCGECSVLCPLNALVMEVDGKEIATIVENEAFPVLVKEITVSKEKCVSDCDFRCQKECPTEAIKVSTTSSENGETLERIDVKIDKSLCVYCRRCEFACDQKAILVKKPFMGKITVNLDACPEGCVACSEVCPTYAIHIEDGKPAINDELCIFCSACEKVCPNQAIEMTREWVFHMDVQAAAWLTALKKLTSLKIVAKELRIKSGKRRAHVVRAREIKIK